MPFPHSIVKIHQDGATPLLHSVGKFIRNNANYLIPLSIIFRTVTPGVIIYV